MMHVSCQLVSMDCRSMGVVVLLAATSRVAAAAPVIFTDEAAFNAALAAAGLTTATESFEGVDAGIHGELDFGAFALEPTFLNFVTDEAATDGTNSLVVLAVSFIPTFVFDGPIRAFSMDVIGALDRNGGDLIVERRRSSRRPAERHASGRQSSVPRLHRSRDPLHETHILLERFRRRLRDRSRALRRRERDARPGTGIVDAAGGRPSRHGRAPAKPPAAAGLSGRSNQTNATDRADQSYQAGRVTGLTTATVPDSAPARAPAFTLSPSPR